MKRMIVVCLMVSLMPVVYGQFVENFDLNAGSTGWSATGDWGSPYFYSGICSLGGWGNGRGASWSNASIWQNTGDMFEADTLYTMEVSWKDPADGGLDIESIMLAIQDVSAGWTDIVGAWYGPAAAVDQWNTAVLTFDTSSNPSVVGHQIGVGVRLTSSTGTWLHLDSISLVPEPATMALLGLGSLAALRRRK